MVKPRLQDPHDPITEHQVRQFESQIGARLPEDYRAFLLGNNGGDFSNYAVFECVDRHGRPDALLVDRLYGLSVKMYGLEDTHRELDTYLPSDFVPIGGDGLGNQICIVVSGRDVGSIWLWDHEAGISDEWPPLNSDRVADSFDEFINGIIYDPEAEDQWQETIPAFHAAEQGDLETLVRNLDRDFDLDSSNDRGQTLLICAAANRQSQVVKMLLSQGANVKAFDYQRRTALHSAAAHRSFDSIKLLLDAGAELEVVDGEGNTPLLVATRRSHRREALYLIGRGANVNATDAHGRKPLDFCTGQNSNELRAALVRAGAAESN